MKKRLLAYEEKLELANYKHENMNEEEGFSFHNGIGTETYYDLSCPDCGFELPFHCTDMKGAQEAWSKYILESDIWVSTKTK